jgi:hypothetical protein
VSVVPMILLQWGFQWGDIRSPPIRIATEIKIGTVSFSLIGILTGILVFVVGFLATRWFQGWLDGSVMARGRVDAGVRNSIRTAVGYAGVALAGLIGMSAAGIDLSNLALVAGALSLGIGFGLQNVVSNFVSGLILLAERPFKVGDWVVAGAVFGHSQEDQRARHRDRDLPAPDGHHAEFGADQCRGRQLDPSQQARPCRDQGRRCLWLGRQESSSDIARHRQGAPAGAEEPGTLRALCSIRRFVARFRDQTVSVGHFERLDCSKRYSVRHCRRIR